MTHPWETNGADAAWSKSHFSISVICTGGRPIPATCGTDQGKEQTRFAPTMRVVCEGGNESRMPLDYRQSSFPLNSGDYEGSGNPKFRGVTIFSPHEALKFIARRQNEV